MISKEEFVEIINKLKQVNDFVDETNDRARKLDNDIIKNFFYANSLFILHEDIVVKLLENMFNDTDMISYYFYELDYGRNFKLGMVQEEKDGKIINIDLSTPEKLYDYLIEEKG